MEKSALNLTEHVSLAEPGPAVENSLTFKVVPYPPADSGRLLAPPLQRPTRHHGRRRKLIRFIQLETIALFFLVLTLAGATTEPFRKAGLTTTLEIAMVVAASAVGVIPVIFYGLPRPRYRYRARRIGN